MNLFAYLDPGTGTVIVQAILGGAAGVAVLFKTMGGRFRRKKSSDEPKVTEVEDADDPTVPSPTSD